MRVAKFLFFKIFVLFSILIIVTPAGAFEVTVHLEDINSATTEPPGSFRWLDVANQQYDVNWIASYDYTQAEVTVTYEIVGDSLTGTVTATNLKPNFAYQLKLSGIPGSAADERIGLAGRWWQEEWNGTEWTNGQNLNNKGVSLRPVYPELNPNDVNYIARKDILYTGSGDPSPTGLLYKFTGYLVFDYFITDENGDATFSFEADSSYHVLWATNDSDGNDGVGHRDRSPDDGPLKESTFDADLSLAYDDTGGGDFPPRTVAIFGEWERLPVGGIFPEIGDDFEAQLILTEESFHGSGGQYTGGWAAAMSGDIIYGALVIEAEDMPIKTTGMSISGGWNIYSNGYIADNVDFAAGGTVSFEVIARGSYAGGAWPIMEVRIDQTQVGTVTVDSSSWAAYTIQASITAGTHEVAIAFTNDYYNSPDDRNLYVDKVTITAAGGNLSPEASIMADNINGTVPLLVNFDGSGSHDPDGEIISYEWDFGDGTIDSGDTVSHIFSDPRVYTVRLTVTDDQSATSSDTIQITASSGSGVDALVIEAEDAAIKTTGGPISDGWNLWSNGTLEEYISIPAVGTYEVVVRAYGSPLGGIWPEMALSIDDIAGEMVTVDSADYMDYVFQIDITPGIHTIGVSFLNDAWNPGVEDRNLYLDRFTIISPPGIGAPELAP